MFTSWRYIDMPSRAAIITKMPKPMLMVPVIALIFSCMFSRCVAVYFSSELNRQEMLIIPKITPIPNINMNIKPSSTEFTVVTVTSIIAALPPVPAGCLLARIWISGCGRVRGFCFHHDGGCGGYGFLSRVRIVGGFSLLVAAGSGTCVLRTVLLLLLLL